MKKGAKTSHSVAQDVFGSIIRSHSRKRVSKKQRTTLPTIQTTESVSSFQRRRAIAQADTARTISRDRLPSAVAPIGPPAPLFGCAPWQDRAVCADLGTPGLLPALML